MLIGFYVLDIPGTRSTCFLFAMNRKENSWDNSVQIPFVLKQMKKETNSMNRSPFESLIYAQSSFTYGVFSFKMTVRNSCQLYVSFTYFILQET